MSPWRRLAPRRPLASSLTRARRSISDERSMPIALSARGPNNSIIRPVPVPISTSRPIGSSPSAVVDRLLDLGFGDVERADAVPRVGMDREIARRGLGAVGADGFEPRDIGGELGLRLGPAPALDGLEHGPRAVAVGRASGTPSCLPCAARRARRRRGCGHGAKRAAGSARACCASSPTDNSIDRSSARMRSRLGSASAWKSAESGASVDIKQTYKDIFIWVNRSRPKSIVFFPPQFDCATRRGPLMPRAGLTEYPAGRAWRR